MLYNILKSIVIFLLKIFFNFKIKGKEVLPKNKPFILASNHLSNLDPIVLGAACPFRLVYLAKEELFKNRLFAIFIKRLGAIPVKRETQDIKTLRLAIKILQNKPIVIFPQGRRSKNYDEFKSGIGLIWRKTNAPVIAAKIYGTDKAMPPRSKFLRLANISVIFDLVSNLEEKDTNDIIAFKVIEKIRSLN